MTLLETLDAGSLSYGDLPWLKITGRDMPSMAARM